MRHLRWRVLLLLLLLLLQLLSHAPAWDVDAPTDGFSALSAAAVEGRAGDEAGGPVQHAECSWPHDRLRPVQQQPRLTPARPPARPPLRPPAEAAIWLLQHGADVNTKKDDAWQDTPLHYAAARSHVWESPEAALEVLQVLTAFGADPAAGNFHGATPADVAEAAGNTAAVDYLRQVLHTLATSAALRPLSSLLRRPSGMLTHLLHPRRWQAVSRTG
jgi:hypothetical protein